MDSIGNNFEINNDVINEQNNIEGDIVVSDENFLDSFVMSEAEKTEKLEDKLIKRMLNLGLRVRLKEENDGLRPFYSIDENKTPLLKVGYEKLLNRAKESHKIFSERYLNSEVELVDSREEAQKSVMETLIDKGKIIEKYCIISNNQLDRVVTKVKDSVDSEMHDNESLEVVIDKAIKTYNPLRQFGLLSKVTNMVKKKVWKNVDFSKRMQVNENVWRNNIDLIKAEVDRLQAELLSLYESNDCIENELLFVASFNNLLKEECERVNDLNDSIDNIKQRGFVGEDQEIENEDVFVKSMWEKLLWEVEKEKNLIVTGHDRNRKYQFLEYLDAYTNEVLSGESNKYITGKFVDSVPISIRGLCKFVYNKAKEKIGFVSLVDEVNEGRIEDEKLSEDLSRYFERIDFKMANIDVVKEYVMNLVKLRSVEIFSEIEEIENDDKLFWITVKAILGREDMVYEEKIRFMEMVDFLINNRRTWGEGLPFSTVNNLIDYSLKNKNELKKQETICLVEKTINVIGKTYDKNRRENDKRVVDEIKRRYNGIWLVCDGHFNERRYQMYIWK